MKLKKTLSLFLVILLTLAVAPSVLADGTTALTTTVPGPEYTLNIPADQTIEYGATGVSIGTMQVTESSGFAQGKDLAVTVTYTAFSCADTDTTIEFLLRPLDASGETIIGSVGDNTTYDFKGQTDGSLSQYSKLGNNPGDVCDFLLMIDSTTWGQADPGNYTGAITFTAQVVNG